MTAGDKLRARRENANFTLEDLAKKLGIRSKSYVSNLENGYAPIGQKMRLRLAEIFKCSPDHFNNDAPQSADRVMDIRDISTEMHTWINIAIMGRAPAGEPREAYETFMGFYPAPAAMIRGDKKNYIFVRATGESMIGLQIRDGDNMLVHLQEEANDGDIVIARVEGDGVTCKTFRIKKGVPSLEAANPASKPIVGKDFRIVGKVIWRGG